MVVLKHCFLKLNQSSRVLSFKYEKKEVELLEIFMKKLLISTALMILPFTSIAGESKVIWNEVESYTDFASHDEVSTGYYKKMKNKLELHVEKLAQRLPEGQSITVEFENIDRAGDLGYGNDIRVAHLGSMKLVVSYRLVDAAGDVISEGNDIVLSGVEDISGSVIKMRQRNKSFAMEKKLLDKLFTQHVMAS